MPRLQRLSFVNSDKVRKFPNGEFRLVTLDDTVKGLEGGREVFRVLS